MEITDYVALAAALTYFLWSGISKTPIELRRKNKSDFDELELLLSLQAGIHSAQSFDDLVESLNLRTFCSIPTTSRIEQISDLTRRYGISASLLVSELITTIQNQRLISHKWKESMAAPKTASLLLFLIPIPLLAGATASGLEIFDWILWHPIGRFVFLIGFAISVFSGWRLKRASPLKKSQESKIPKISAKLAGGLLAAGMYAISPNFWGLLLGGFLFLIVQHNWYRFQTLADLQASKELTDLRPRVVTELAAAVTAGLDWKTAVSAVELPSKFQGEWSDIHQRIAWGVSVPAAFSNSSWNQISTVVDQALRTGAPISNALFELAGHWQRARLSSALTEIEQRAAKNVVWVTLLQLPAFILMGLIPLVAASIFPLLKVFGN